MERAFRDLIEFERACGHEPSDRRPMQGLSDSLIKLRIRLIDEEFSEFINAVRGDGSPEADAEVADALADLCYVAIGTAVRFGIDLPAVWDAVHAANRAKHGPGSWRDEGGKIQKPPGWTHPDIGAILRDQKTLAETYGDPTEVES